MFFSHSVSAIDRSCIDATLALLGYKISVNKPVVFRADGDGDGDCVNSTFYLLRRLQHRRGFNLKKAEVLIMSHVNEWRHHVVILSEGKVWDVDTGIKSANGKTLSVSPISSREFFANLRYDERSKVRMVNGPEYIFSFKRLTAFVLGLAVDEGMSAGWTRAINQGYPIRDLSEAIQDLLAK